MIESAKYLGVEISGVATPGLTRAKAQATQTLSPSN